MTRGLEAVAALSKPAIAGPERIDAHGHPVPGLTANRVISLTGQVRTRRIALLATGRNDGLTAEIHGQVPQRFLPFVSSICPAWHRLDERVLPYTER